MRYFLLILTCMLLVAPSVKADEFKSSAGNLNVSVVVSGLENPWSLAFLPDGRILVTERPGRMRLVSDGVLSKPLSGLPEIFVQGQGGLLDVIVDPKSSERPVIYFSFSEEENGKAGTAVARAELNGEKLENVKVIFRQLPKVTGKNHWGSRLVLSGDGNIFITLGERFDYSKQAQKLDNHLGKVIRVRTDGSIPADNPFVGVEGAMPEIWSYGHRNVQGAALEPATGRLWTVEHGPMGGDELNITEAGVNYGWPEVSYGSHYNGVPIPDNHAERGFREPFYYWNPSIATSGLIFYTADGFPKWKGNVFVGAMAAKMLVRLTISDGKVTGEERLLQELGERIRDVRQGPDGWIYLLTDNKNGRLLRIEASENAN